jgi:hypothetical protein
VLWRVVCAGEAAMPNASRPQRQAGAETALDRVAAFIGSDERFSMLRTCQLRQLRAEFNLHQFSQLQPALSAASFSPWPWNTLSAREPARSRV